MNETVSGQPNPADSNPTQVVIRTAGFQPGGSLSREVQAIANVPQTPEVLGQTESIVGYLTDKIRTDALNLTDPNDKEHKNHPENVRLWARVLERAEELGVEQADLEKTAALLYTLQDISPYTFGHALRVSLAAVEIADELKVDTEFYDDPTVARDTFLAALNHDNGKVIHTGSDGQHLLDDSGQRVVPDELILSLDTLRRSVYDTGWGPEQRAQMAAHSEAGKNLADFVGLPAFVGDIAGTHHVLQGRPAGMVDHFNSELDDRTRFMATAVTLADSLDATMSRDDQVKKRPTTAENILGEQAVQNEKEEYAKKNIAFTLGAGWYGVSDLGDMDQAIVDEVFNAGVIGRRGEPSTRVAHPMGGAGPEDIGFLLGIGPPPDEELMKKLAEQGVHEPTLRFATGRQKHHATRR